jgi:hypothetical protein
MTAVVWGGATHCMRKLQLRRLAHQQAAPVLRWKFKVLLDQPFMEFGCIPASLQVGVEQCTHAAQPWLQRSLPLLLCLQDNQNALHTLVLSTCSQRPVGVRSAATVSHLPPDSLQLLGTGSACVMPASCPACRWAVPCSRRCSWCKAPWWSCCSGRGSCPSSSHSLAGGCRGQQLCFPRCQNGHSRALAMLPTGVRHRLEAQVPWQVRVCCSALATEQPAAGPWRAAPHTCRP